ncbi:cyclophilin-like protein [Metschnikowia bicuspidata var. bicuspidata NRRL YB-4993]|uniref:Cyclophilin-like protein n=1 Tax=Metschnikowia bicuspidata var. bicuspidata NRRL YB-4993 TaxID=869754 RepID=A0A1A0H797_9ASCO|nr:cyclophilin-like protein [Metschnikowia bicuspidata var. bicuspidata NRRL YB-4993]OBA19969.1 cyclophilin-like protein [Metschnikowia bicuspidata var. bicuspidata NRRL YB-4993]
MDIKPTAQVTLVTTKGNIDIQLFPKELPELCREFIRNCVNKKYVGLEFSKVTSSLIQTLQIDSSPEIKREKNSRIKFNTRGSVGLLRIENTRMSSANGFFISLDPISAYSADYVFIGNVVGDSIYNVVKIKDSELKPGTDMPLYSVRITDCVATQPYFDDLQERTSVLNLDKKRKKQKIAVSLQFEEENDENVGEQSEFVVRPAHELLIGNKSTKGSERVNTTTKETEPQIIEAKSLKISRAKGIRDPSIDPYQSDLDFSEDEISYETLRMHKFICRQ